jgi:hypothetical protein
MNKYFIRDVLVRYVYTRRAAQIKGEEVVDLDQFIENDKQQPFLLRTKHYLNNLSQFCIGKLVCFSQKNSIYKLLYICRWLLFLIPYTQYLESGDKGSLPKHGGH